MWSRLKGVLEVVSTVAVVGLCAVVVWDVYDRRSPSPTPKSDARTASEGPLPTEPVSFALAQTKGGLTAKVGIIEYSDFSAPTAVCLLVRLYPS
jgi:hypothetical protein